MQWTKIRYEKLYRGSTLTVAERQIQAKMGLGKAKLFKFVLNDCHKMTEKSFGEPLPKRSFDPCFIKCLSP